jgi:phospho-N-acetylmuramoyl-pentapeptide-transferase
LIWLTTLTFALFFWVFLKIDQDSKLTQFLNFISRRQTFIPFATIFFGALFGLIDDAFATLENGGNYFAGGLKLRQRLLLVGILSLGVSIWFYFKLGITSLSLFSFHIDFINLGLPWLIIPITIILLVGLFGTSVLDGFDGLFASTFLPIYISFAILSFARGYFEIATLLMVMTGGILAFLWYNISPAKFFMGDTGSLPIVLTLGVVSILIDAVYLVPIIAIIPVITALSNIIQLLSKKILKKKVFLAAPYHHHLEAIGWSKNQIVFRYFVISMIFSCIGLALGLIFR